MAQQYGAETPVNDWRERLICSRCGNREIDNGCDGDEALSRTEGIDVL
jgi:hypothetical protein